MLHGLLASVGVLKLAVVIVALCYWRNFEITGQDIVQLKYLQSFIYALSETAFFCALLLISKGWRITRSNLPPSEIRTISVALVLLLSTLLFFSFYNDGYYFLSLMIMYFFMLPKIFTSITRNTRALHTHMLLARYANIELNTIPIFAKIQMFKTLRTAVILYLGSILVISSMKIIMWWFLVWVTYCVSECVTIVMVVAVCYLTRPRENGVFSPRAYFEGGTFPILNMQQFDHFDELFGDQIWDPDLVFGNALAAQAAQPQIDMSEAIVIEYPVAVMDEKDESSHPLLAIAMLEKKDGGNDGLGGNGGLSGEKRSLFRRRGTSSNSSSYLSSSPYLASSSTALLAPSPLMSSASSTPLLLNSSPSMPPLSSYAHLDLDVSGIGMTAQVPTLNLSSSAISPPTTTVATTTTTSSNSPNEFIENNNLTRHKRRTRTNSNNNYNSTTTTTTTQSTSNSEEFIPSSEMTTPTISSKPKPPNDSCNTTEKSTPKPLAELELSPQFTSTSSLLSTVDKDDELD